MRAESLRCPFCAFTERSPKSAVALAAGAVTFMAGIGCAYGSAGQYCPPGDTTYPCGPYVFDAGGNFDVHVEDATRDTGHEAKAADATPKEASRDVSSSEGSAMDVSTADVSSSDSPADVSSEAAPVKDSSNQ